MAFGGGATLLGRSPMVGQAAGWRVTFVADGFELGDEATLLSGVVASLVEVVANKSV